MNLNRQIMAMSNALNGHISSAQGFNPGGMEEQINRSEGADYVKDIFIRYYNINPLLQSGEVV